jgi:hypothetical protein
LNPLYRTIYDALIPIAEGECLLDTVSVTNERIAQRITALCQRLEHEQLDVYLVPSADSHLNMCQSTSNAGQLLVISAALREML